MELQGRVAVVTGGASGIGRGICLEMAKAGADVVVADINAPGAEAVAGEVASLGRRSMVCVVDVTKRPQVEKMVQDALARLGQVDILVNDAGVGGAAGWSQHEWPREEDWETAYQVNVQGLVLCCYAVVPHMMERRYGKIVNIASIAGRQGRPALPHYSASKAAVINWTQSLALRLAPYNINVNAICPGLLWTPLWEQIAQRYLTFFPEMAGLTGRQVFERMVERLIPMKKEQTPQDIGRLAVFLASESARCITGQSINVDGGAFLN